MRGAGEWWPLLRGTRMLYGGVGSRRSFQWILADILFPSEFPLFQAGLTCTGLQSVAAWPPAPHTHHLARAGDLVTSLRALQWETRRKTRRGIGETHQEPTGALRASLTLAVNCCHAEGRKVRTGPAGALLSQTATKRLSCPMAAVSTQLA